MWLFGRNLLVAWEGRRRARCVIKAVTSFLQKFYANILDESQKIKEKEGKKGDGPKATFMKKERARLVEVVRRTRAERHWR